METSQEQEMLIIARQMRDDMARKNRHANIVVGIFLIPLALLIMVIGFILVA